MNLEHNSLSKHCKMSQIKPSMLVSGDRTKKHQPFSNAPHSDNLESSALISSMPFSSSMWNPILGQPVTPSCTPSKLRRVKTTQPAFNTVVFRITSSDFFSHRLVWSCWQNSAQHCFGAPPAVPHLPIHHCINKFFDEVLNFPTPASTGPSQLSRVGTASNACQHAVGSKSLGTQSWVGARNGLPGSIKSRHWTFKSYIVDVLRQRTGGEHHLDHW